MTWRLSWRMVGVSFVSSLLLSWSPAPAQETPEQRTELRDYYSGNGLLNRGLHDLAANQYEQFLEAHPAHEKSPVARYGLSVCRFRLQQYEQAVIELEKLLDLEDFEFAAEVAMILGQSQHALGNFEDAADACGIVLEAHLDHDLAPNAAVLGAEALYRAGRYRAARKPCELFAATWSGHPLRERAELFWGMSDMALGEFDLAAERLSDLLERYRGGQYNEQASLLLAQCLHRTKGLGRALLLYEKVIQGAKEEFVPDALYGLALLMHQRGRPEGAGELVDELLDRFPESPLITNASLLRGRIWFDLGNYDRAIDALEGITDVSGDHLDDTEYWLAKCELRLGKTRDAARRFSRAIDRYPDSDLRSEMMYDRAIALLRSDEEDEALEALAEFRKEYPGHDLAPDGLQLTASTYHRQQNYKASARHCADFRRLYPEHELIASIDFLTAENEFLQQDFPEAIKAYRDFLNRHGDDEQAEKATFRFGMAQYQMGAFDEAESSLLQVVKGTDTDSRFWSALLALGDGYFQRGDWNSAQRFLATYLSAENEQASTDDALLKLGLALHRQDKREEGIEQYDRLIRDYEESPHRLQAIFERGQALVSLGDDIQAERAFQQVLELDPVSVFAPHAYNHLGSIALRAEEFEAAAMNFDHVAGFDSGTDLAAEALFQSGQAKMALQHFDRAEAVFARLIDEHPSHDRRPQAGALLAIVLARQDKYEDALDRIADTEKNFLEDINAKLKATLYYEKAWCLRDLDRSDEAAIAYRKVLELDQRDNLQLYSLLELAELQSADEYDDGAVTLLSRLIEMADEIDHETPETLIEQARYRLGVCQFRLELFADAATTLEGFINQFDESDLIASASLLCGESMIKTGRHRDAVVQLQRVVRDHAYSDAYGPSLLRLGEANVALSRWSRSEKAFTEYREAMSDSELWFQAQFGIGYAQENQNRYEEAILAYRQVVDRHQGPTAARAQFQIGECLYALKRFDEAAAELLMVDILYAYPKWSAASLYEAGRCFQEMANPLEARRQFELVVNDHGDTEWARLARERLSELSRVNLPGHSTSDS